MGGGKGAGRGGMRAGWSEGREGREEGGKRRMSRQFREAEGTRWRGGEFVEGRGWGGWVEGEWIWCGTNRNIHLYFHTLPALPGTV